MNDIPLALLGQFLVTGSSQQQTDLNSVENKQKKKKFLKDESELEFLPRPKWVFVTVHNAFFDRCFFQSEKQ